MKASELRIGNFVDTINRNHEIHLPYGYVQQVGSIEFFKVHLYEIGNFALQDTYEVVDIKNICPIPLTEEWLLKFGFETMESENDFDKEIYSHPAKSTTGRKLPFFIQKCLDGSYSPPLYMDVHERIIYVHQLQNLYFALTGEELTIKPNP